MSSILNNSLLDRCVASGNFAEVNFHEMPPLHTLHQLNIEAEKALSGSEKLAELFKRAFCCRELYTDLPAIFELRRKYLELFRDFCTIYHADILPLLMRTLQCHQTALRCFLEGRVDMACQAMAETKESAARLKIHYKTLTGQCELLANSTREFSLAVMQLRSSTRSHTTNDTLEKAVLKAKASALHISANSLLTIKGVIEGIRLTWMYAADGCESEDNLADPDMLELMSSAEYAESANLAEEQQALGCTGFQAISSCNGITTFLPRGDAGSRAFIEQLRYHTPSGVKEAFDKSCLQWLALGLASEKMTQLATRFFD